ncbi:flavodoxin family protein [Pseudarthrobacter phenanthrenivorans]|uniref:flavodoxin family protein n=1 Tax=Pseudarthrobacter phenanthrenivorans TaxID=361575 RepID=UPI00112ADA95|nr:flavodoxin domain-containing protein [Pseudarthrobacter phenanthrenivorans]TPV53152.1 flavodoxin family protein [Pseudarthrobacter phenanthrenivorans]
MKTHIVYDSAYGNTRTIAEALASRLGNNAAAVPVDRFDARAVRAGDLLVVGSPINGWRPTAKIAQALADLAEHGLAGVKAAAFDTRLKLFIHGDAAKKISRALKDAGASIVSGPMAFYVKGSEGPLLQGEEERAASWAGTLLASLKDQASHGNA